MGLFDSIYFCDKTSELVCCKAGHPQLNVELQTKDLDCVMSRYYVYGGTVYELGNSVTEIKRANDGLKRVTEIDMFVSLINKDVSVYAPCEQCRPAIFETDSPFNGYVDYKRPWNEWTLTIRLGKIECVTLTKGETTEDLEAKMRKNGVEVLSKDDRIAVKHLKKLAEKKENW